jgi:hypothetical protein
MSNAICVKDFCRLSYSPCRWDGDQLLAFVRDQWVKVEKSNRKNKYGDIIFVIKH